MKRLHIAFGIMFLSVCHIFATNYYVSPSGSDNNSGTQSSPFATIMRAQQAASSGDVVYLRGGTYHMSNAQIASTSSPYAYVHTINKSGISYFAYSGETPVIDMSNVKPSGLRVVAFYVTADNCHFRGIEIVGTQVTITSHTVSYVFRVNNADNNTFERLNVHDGMATAVYIVGNSKNNLILNCDSYNNWDSVSENGSGENTDGFGCHITTGGTGNVFRGCRAWFNSDDGYDCIGAEEKVIIDHCWAFYNGYSTSFSSLANGNGFKAGGYGINNPVNPPSIIPRHLVQFCLAVRNKANGFYANHHLGGNDWYNNSAYYNGTNYNMLCAVYNSSSNTATDIDGYDHKMRNNLGYDARGTEVANLNQSASDVSYNYFTLGVSVTSSDFESLAQSLLTAPRQTDGSLPDNDFMKLVSGSDLIDKGQDIGEPYNGSSPDLGCFESGGGGGCTPTAITPYLQIDGGSWSGASSATLDPGQNITFGPQPASGGSWSWSGPNNFSSSSREVTISNIQTNQAGSYVAIYTNSCGAQSSQAYSITVSGGSTSYPVIYSFSSEQSGNPASNILDGNNADDSRWSAESFPQWVIVDYGANKSIIGTRLWTYQDRAYQFTIELDDNVNFSSPYTINRSSNTDNTQPIADNFPAQTARYARITVTGASGYTGSWASLTEFSIVEGTSTPVTLTIQENETGFCSVDGTVDSDHTGYTGSGFANTDNASGNGVTWSVNVPSAQNCQVVWGYSNGGATDRTAQIMVNGSVAVSSFSMPSTGSWDTWNETSQQSISLPAGTSLVRLQATNSSGLSNIDYMRITGAGLTAVSCTGLKSTSKPNITENGTDMDITCYPVPVNDQLNIVFNKELTETANILLLNAAGETLYSGSLNSGTAHTVSTAGLPDGLYLIRITGQNINITKHIIK